MAMSMGSAVTTSSRTDAATRSISIRLSLLLLLFLAITIGSYLGVKHAIGLKTHDSARMNLAGRQRMLIQQFGRESLSDVGQQRVSQASSLTVRDFESTHRVLVMGGAITGPDGRTVVLDPESDPAILASLDEASHLWLMLRDSARHLRSSVPDSERQAFLIAAVNDQTENAVRAMNAVVSTIQRVSEQRLETVHHYLLTATALGVVVVIATMLFARVRIVRPLRETMSALEASTQRTRAVMESAGDGVCTVDRDGVLWSLNAAACDIFGRSVDDIGGQSAEPMIVPLDRVRFRTAIEMALRQDHAHAGPVSTEVVVARPDGTEVPVEMSLSAISGEEGELCIAIMRDTTARQQMLDALRDARDASDRAAAAKAEFLANMSHEIRTPMTAILGYTELLLDPAHSATDFTETVETIRRNGEHLLNLINDILDVSKLDAGRMRVESIACCPGQIVNDVVTLMRVRADGKGLTLQTQLDGAVPRTIHSDPTRLRQILVNLVGNAIKFTEVGEVRIALSMISDEATGEPQLAMRVMDTGIGMDAEAMSRLFQAFSQADESMTRRFGGTGLGLTISKRLAELLGGDIEVESEAGVGTTFTLRVGVGNIDSDAMIVSVDEFIERRGDDSESIVQASSPGAALPLRNVRILLAEDGPDNQRLISFHMTKAGAQIHVASNGREACEVIQANLDATYPFDLVLMDMQMPEMDGYEATRTLRAAGIDLPIIALTAHAMAGDRQRCLDAGCDEYATKPIDRVKLVELIREQLDAVAARRAASSDQPDRPASVRPS